MVAVGRFPGRKTPRTFSNIVPDLVVEIISPSDRAAAAQQKTEGWLRSSARLVLNVYPEMRTVAAFWAKDGYRGYYDGEDASFGPVLPDLSLPVSEIFYNGDE